VSIQLNHVILSGNLVRDPRPGLTSEGKSYSRFTVAVNNWRTKKADFIGCTCWGKKADFVNTYLGKGDMVVVEGRLSQSQYEKNGITVYEVSVMAFDVQTPPRKNRDEGGDYGDANAAEEREASEFDKDLAGGSDSFEEVDL